ncbi:MAG: hypothetical protein K1Y02_11905 [Candidatus Hydrogenedentes bacterium]|nr:hypothetical protein [Candidatus Hydrogenedentota bacterium]
MRRHWSAWTVCVWLGVAGIAYGGVPVADLLPDIIVDPDLLNDHSIVTNIEPGHVHLRFANGTPNIGDGPLYMIGETPLPDSETQLVDQRVFRSDDSYYDRPAGEFIYHPTHNHTHVDDWAAYRLRAVLPGDGVGDIVAEGGKTSFCLRDTEVFDGSLPNVPAQPFFVECSTQLQGISVGYQDVYTKNLPDQWIDITNVPDGTYWLESEADPHDHVLEKNESNNVARVKLNIVKPAPQGGGFGGIFAVLIALFQQILNAILGLFGGGL